MLYSDWIIGYIRVVEEVHIVDTALVDAEIPSLCELLAEVDQRCVRGDVNLMHALYADPEYAKEFSDV